jgi:hypothetical protein
MQIGSIALSRGAQPPLVVEAATDQIVRKNEDGSIHITEQLFGKEEFVRIRLKLELVEARRIEDFLVNGCRFRAVPTTINTGVGQQWTVRYWDKSFRQKYIGAGLIEIDLLFRREATG